MRIVKHKNKFRVVTGYLWSKKVLSVHPTYRNAEIWINRHSNSNH
jgi:hypothetical protein